MTLPAFFILVEIPRGSRGGAPGLIGLTDLHQGEGQA